MFGGVEEELTVRCYTDDSFQSDRDDSRSQLGFVFTLNGEATCLNSSKQSVVADLATESKYIAASDAAKEAAWMKIIDLKVVSSIQNQSRCPVITQKPLLKPRSLDLITGPSTF